MYLTPRSHRLHLLVLGAVSIASGLVTVLSFGAIATTWQLRAQGWYLDARIDEPTEDARRDRETTDALTQ